MIKWAFLLKHMRNELNQMKNSSPMQKSRWESSHYGIFYSYKMHGYNTIGIMGKIRLYHHPKALGPSMEEYRREIRRLRNE